MELEDAAHIYTYKKAEYIQKKKKINTCCAGMAKNVLFKTGYFVVVVVFRLVYLLIPSVIRATSKQREINRFLRIS